MKRLLITSVLVATMSTSGMAQASIAPVAQLSLSAQGAHTCTVSVNGRPFRSLGVSRQMLVVLSLRFEGRPKGREHAISAGCGSQRKGSLRSRRRLASVSVSFSQGEPIVTTQESPGASASNVPATTGAAPAPELPAGPPTPVLPVVEHPHLQPWALALARKAWASAGKEYDEGHFHDGQCVELVAAKRPDIVERTMITVWAESAETGRIVWQELDWDANFWDANAAHAGYEVSATPSVGSIMVFHPKAYNHETAPGHGAYVEAVEANGSVVISEEHAPELWTVDQRTVTAQEMAGQDIDFIHEAAPLEAAPEL
jgi:hypothetical protein